MTNENMVIVKTLERCFVERIDREMSNFVETVEDKTQNAILTTIDSIVAPKIELAFRLINASSGQDATSFTAISERGEEIGITACFENVSEGNVTLHVLNMNAQTRNNIPDEVSELSVPGAHYDRQSHTHHSFFVSEVDFVIFHNQTSSISLKSQCSCCSTGALTISVYQ